MEEKRRTKRTSMPSKLIMKRVCERQQIDIQESEEEVSIEILDVSKNGVGFKCKEALEIGAVYEVYLSIWTKEVLHTFLEIVRIELLDKEFCYGAVFIGMPWQDAHRIEVYQSFHDSDIAIDNNEQEQV